ncbi:nose resistant to fluoxetine protein 6-like isoform X1 [Photinus pyralis]|uniref:nose resistant to fluoxetine protein 6-like isoform X1 n=1 Tax=Photinus pyralis TaxID=7054 RepID=UPI0012673680|nr:nose resistant to fluoxetine protein 6-like isoform X1 [Photinus pyralis]
MLYLNSFQHSIKFAFLSFTLILAPRVADADYLGQPFGVLSSPQIFSKSLLWYLSQEPPLTQRCRNELTDFANSLRRDRQWALNMYDANGKLSAGLLEGNFVEMGSFDECLRIARTNNHGLTGKYCLGSLYVPSRYVNNATTRIMHAGVQINQTDFAVCFPSSCPAADLQTVMKGIGFNLTVTENRCQTKATQDKTTAGSYVTLTLACIILLLIVVSTIYDFACEEKPHWALHAFSLRANGRQIFENTTPSDNDIRSLYGIRTIAMTMVIVTHIFSYRVGGLKRNTYYYSYWIHQVKNGPLIPTVYAVDIFLMLSGCLVSFNFLQKCLRGQSFKILPYYIERYLRLTPALLAIFLFAITWYGCVGSGPQWYLIDLSIHPCLTHWWSYLLYIQNYFPTSLMCVGPTWYLSVDFQLYILSPILLLPLKRWPKETLVVTAGLALFSMAPHSHFPLY